MPLIGAVTGGAQRAANGTSSCAATAANVHDNARLMPVFDGEYPAARNLVQPRHRQAPSFSHERRTHGEATRNDEEPLN